MGNSKFPVKVVIVLSLHVGCKVVAGDDGVGLKNDANGVVDGGPSSFGQTHC